MKDDLVEQVSATIKRLTRAHAPATPEELARAILAMARPAILEEAAKVAEAEGVYPELNIFAGGPEWYKHGRRIAAAIRALAPTTGQEGGRWQS